ncbi:MAG: hypothetical protein IPJ89_00290 [Candidatus Iainarchaeum archaeon]|uniref:NTP pyrophosphohydrolase MazG-like domain-containing protein n=1 Tax=Candidatus Iainarchaeum sp. TaxID=3101447 RepID=A0A7T9DJY3_9ARCH|nr:MAG: hypothetical protein IPJ89_00290 [Candidatus Diapherotrites archaeon]
MPRTIQEMQTELQKLLKKRENEHPFVHLAAFMEETAELSQDLSQHLADKYHATPEEKTQTEERIGDVLVSVAALANYLGMDLESAYEKSIRKVRARHHTEWTLKDALAYQAGEKHFVFDSPTNWLEQLKLEFQNIPVHIDNDLRISEKFLPWLQEGKKKTLFRFEKNAICVPSAPELVLYESSAEPLLTLGTIALTGFIIKPFRELHDEDARAQGYNSKIEFITAMKNLYEPRGLTDDSLISLYHIQGFKTMNG